MGGDEQLTPAERAREAAKTLEDPSAAHKAAREKMLGLAREDELKEQEQRRKLLEKRRAVSDRPELDPGNQAELKRKEEEEINRLEMLGSARAGVAGCKDEFKQQSITDGTAEEAEKNARRFKDLMRQKEEERLAFETERSAQMEAASNVRSKQLEAAQKRLQAAQEEKERKRPKFTVLPAGKAPEPETRSDAADSHASVPDAVQAPAGLAGLGSYDSGSEEEESEE